MVPNHKQNYGGAQEHEILRMTVPTNLENNMSFVREVYGDVHDHWQNCKKKLRGC